MKERIWRPSVTLRKYVCVVGIQLEISRIRPDAGFVN
jgi:hypothetical protein